MKIFELGYEPGRQTSLDSATATELRKLLSRPLAPLSNLDQRDRRKITDTRLAALATALNQIRPAWIPEYAAAAAIALPLRERRLREFMLRELFQNRGNTAEALAALARHLEKQPGKARKSILTALLRSIAQLPDLPQPGAFEDVQRCLMILVKTTDAPTSPKAFAQLALDVARAAEALSPGSIQLAADNAQSSVDVLLAHLDDVHRMFLLRPRWGSYAGEINALLWHQLWQGWREGASPKASKPTQQTLLKEAAWSEADQALARALQDAGRLIRSLDKLEAATDGEAARRAAAVRGATNLVLQWVRQAARLRNMDSLGTFGQSAEFDPAFHDSPDAAPGERVRITKPTIVRSNGSQQAVILRGEVEPE